jgi:hypothetical protein
MRLKIASVRTNGAGGIFLSPEKMADTPDTALELRLVRRPV